MFKNPAFALVSILSTSLGIGLAAAMFTVFYAVLLGPSSFPQQSRIVAIGQANGPDEHPGSSSLPNVRDWRSANHSFEDIAYWHLSFENLETQGRVHPVASVVAST